MGTKTIEVVPSKSHKVSYIAVDDRKLEIVDNKSTLNIDKKYTPSSEHYMFYDVTVSFYIDRDNFLEKPTIFNKKTKEIDIRTAKELRYIASIANVTTETFENYNIKLMNDIDMGGKNFTGITTGQGKNDTTQFNGVFDGNRYQIKNMYVNVPYTSVLVKFVEITYNPRIGFIGKLGTKGVVKNLTVSSNVTGAEYVGGIVGLNNKDNCVNNGCHNNR